MPYFRLLSSSNKLQFYLMISKVASLFSNFETCVKKLKCFSYFTQEVIKTMNKIMLSPKMYTYLKRSILQKYVRFTIKPIYFVITCYSFLHYNLFSQFFFVIYYLNLNILSKFFKKFIGGRQIEFVY